MKAKVPVLIAARPGRLRDGLRAVLASFPHVEVVGEANDCPALLERLGERAPALILIDAELCTPDEWTVLGTIKEGWSTIHCVVLADEAAQFRPALAAGANGVLIKGFPAAELLRSIGTLLTVGDTPEL